MVILKKIIKILLITIVSLVLVVYGGVYLGHKVIFPLETSNVPTIQAVTDGTFIFGPQAHAEQPQTIDEFVMVFASQLARYNEVASELWPANALVDKSVIIEDIGRNSFWLITPEGEAMPISRAEAMSYGIIRNNYFGGFSLFDNGVYLAVDEGSLKNYLMWEEYLHLGTYDPFLFFSHEGFHAIEQSKWPTPAEIHNRGRSEFYDNAHARAVRALLQEQLLKAVSQPGDIELILDALSTYVFWKEQYPDEYRNSTYFDRIEGTAFYFELVSGLYAGYPDQIKNKNDLDHALSLLATRDDVYIHHGLITEIYTIGGFSSVLLDRHDDGWKERLMNDPYASPISMLLQHFEDEILPTPRSITQEGIDAVVETMQKPPINTGMPLFFKFLFDILF